MIRAGRSIRSRQDYYAQSADPSRLLDGGSTAGLGVPNFRPQRTIEELRRRPESLRTGAGNYRQVGMGQPYTSGVGKPLIEVEDIAERPEEQERRR